MNLPMVYVSRDKEYRRISYANPPTEEELNAMAKEGWLLQQILAHEGQFYAYFTR